MERGRAVSARRIWAAFAANRGGTVRAQEVDKTHERTGAEARGGVEARGAGALCDGALALNHGGSVCLQEVDKASEQ